MDKMNRMKDLVVLLNEASHAYYQESRELMSNYEYDKLYEELENLEQDLGITLSNSPTINVGYEVLSELEKEAHPEKMLSLDKTKEVDKLKEWIGNKEGLLSWKLDGLTIVLTYEEGTLKKAVTRGNGVIGEVITNNAKVFSNLPINIGFKGKLILRGEAVISYEDFEKINQTIDDPSAKYKNPRNLCSGSVRQLNNQITRERGVRFYGFSLVRAEGLDFGKRSEQLLWLKNQGFQIVEHILVSRDTIEKEILSWEAKIENNPIPSDGLVLSLDDIAYGKSLGVTAKFPRDSIAFKWRDEIKDTTLLEIEWSASRTGLINPVAIFEPVELEGTTVSRASVHNISVMEELELGIGDIIQVYKANMIIPQISDNLTRSGNLEIPEFCPVCAERLELRNERGVKTLNCINSECPAKELKSFTHFVSRDGMNIEGLSEATLEKFIGIGILKSLGDIFRLGVHREGIVNMEGFGEKSFDKLIKAVEKAKSIKTSSFLYSLGVANIGKANANLIANYCENKWDKIQSLSKDELLTIDGIGEIMADAYVNFFNKEENRVIISDILTFVDLDESFEKVSDSLAGMTFVITGSLEHFANRDELKSQLEKAGAKVAGSVSNKTSYLVNNDIMSNSGKNKKAKELGVKIITEEEVIDLLK